MIVNREGGGMQNRIVDEISQIETAVWKQVRFSSRRSKAFALLASAWAWSTPARAADVLTYRSEITINTIGAAHASASD